MYPKAVRKRPTTVAPIALAMARGRHRDEAGSLT